MNSKIALLVAVLLIGLTGSVTAESLDSISQVLKTTHYGMKIGIDYDKERLTNSCSMTIKNDGDFSISTIPIQLYRLMTIDSLSAVSSNKITFKQRIETYRDWDQMQVNFVEIYLGRPLAPEGEITLNIYYGGYLHGYAETGMLYVKDEISKEFTILRPDALAFPQIGVPAYKVNRRAGQQEFSYHLSVSVPKPLIVANGGRLVERVDSDSLSTFVFENILPAWRIDIAVANYRLIELDGIKVYNFETDSVGAARILGKAHEALDLFTEWFGPLSEFTSFTIIEIPDECGSQADVTSIIQTAAAFRETNRMSELYHEISHLWNVTETDDYPPRWNEGLASFLELLVAEQLDGVREMSIDSDSTIARLNRYYTKNPERAELSMQEFGRAGVTNLSYSAGMIFYRLLYDLLGHQQFVNLQREFYSKYHATGASSGAYIEFIRDQSGVTAEKLISDWLISNHFVELIADSKTFKALSDVYQ